MNLVWKKSPLGYKSEAFRAPVFRKESFMHHASSEPVMMRLSLTVEKTRYAKTWQLEILQGFDMRGDVLAQGFRTAKEAMQAGDRAAESMGGTSLVGEK